MSLLTNPVLVSVVVLCVLCLLKLNVLMSLIIAAMTGAVLGGISIPDAMGILCDGFSGNANTALAYVLLGTFATAIASTGLADMASKKLSQIMGGKSASIVVLILAAVLACGLFVLRRRRAKAASRKGPAAKAPNRSEES